MDLRAFFQDATNRDAVGQALPEGSVVRFDLFGDAETGEHGVSTWALTRERDRVEMVEDASRYDCKVRCSVADFQALIEGDLDPREGYLSGRLVVLGDVGIVLDLRRAVLKNRAS